MEKNRLNCVKYWFNKKLSFIDKCKIIAHFSNDYEDTEFDFYLKHKRNDTCIDINDNEIIFFHMNAKEALKKYEAIASILYIRDVEGDE